MIRSLGPPDSKTPGNVGDLYQDIETGMVYVCTEVENVGEKHQFVTTHAYDTDANFIWRMHTYKFKDMSYFCASTGPVGPFPRADELDGLDTSEATDFSSMFTYCSPIRTIPKFDTSKGVRFISMFQNAISLESIPELDTSAGVYFMNMFMNCGALTHIPKLNTSSGTTFTRMFRGCVSLESVPELDTSAGTYFSQMFDGCIALKSIPSLDITNADSSSELKDIFYNCASLTELRLYNVRLSITIGSGTSYGHLLTVDSLVHTIKELCKVSTSRTLTIGSANLAKIADLYCKVIDDTTEKIEMELCESTDEGAMTLIDYAALKKWSIQ